MSDLKLDVTNIGGLEGEHSFEFRDGLNIIHAPNASGKTSLLKALRLTIPKGGEDLDDYLTDGRSRGEVEISNDFDQRITLNRSSSGVSYGTKNVKFTDDRARELAFMMEDSSLVEAVREGDSQEIADWFKNITDIQYYEQARDVVSELLTEYQTEKNNKERQLSGSKAQIKKDLRDTRERLEGVEEDIDKLKNDPEFQEVKSRYEELEQKEDELRSELNEIRGKVNSRENDIHAQEDKLESRERHLEEKSEKLEDLREEKESLENRLPELEDEKKELRHEIEKLEIKYENAQDKRKDLEKQLNNYTSLEGENECPTCMRPLDDVDVEDMVEEIRDDLDEVEEKETELDDKIDELVNERREIDDKIEYLNTQLQEDIENQKQEVNRVRNSIAQLESGIEDAQDELENLRPKKEELEKEVREVSEKLKEVDFENEELQEKMNSLRAKRENLLDREAELESDLKELQRGTIEIRELETKIERTDRILEHLASRVDEINERVRSEINQGLKENFELLELADFQEIGIVRDSFEINLIRANGERTQLDELSGAERRLVALIIMAVAKKSFYPEIPFMVIDEVTNSMDDTRFKGVVEWLSDELETVIVSRNAPFKEKEVLQQKHVTQDLDTLEGEAA